MLISALVTFRKRKTGNPITNSIDKTLYFTVFNPPRSANAEINIGAIIYAVIKGRLNIEFTYCRLIVEYLEAAHGEIVMTAFRVRQVLQAKRKIAILDKAMIRDVYELLEILKELSQIRISFR